MARAAPPVSGELQQGVDDLGDQGPQTHLEPCGWPQPREGWIRRTGQQDRSGWKSSTQVRPWHPWCQLPSPPTLPCGKILMRQLQTQSPGQMGL